MAGSTGPILAAGGIVAFNAVILQGQPPVDQTRTVVATLIAAGGLALLEKATPSLAVALAWLALVGTMFVRVDPRTPSPLESFATWYREA